MANINVVGDFKKSGLTQKELKSTVEAVFDVLDPSPSSRAEAEGFLKNKSEGKRFLHSPPSGVGRNDKIINIAFVEAKDIQKKNLEYRKVDKPTDVLSFDYGDEGDILLCLDVIDKYKEGDTLKDSIIKTLIHGSLHLFGYDHEKDKDHAIMEKIANKAFERLSK
ncbi:MAG: rRNA maturation RNase YbeY [Patescibacteria group bacterium]|mgnify:CR=1 FL=1